MDFPALIAACILTFMLARRLCGDPYAASLGAILFMFSPCVRFLASRDPRLAACIALLPLLLLLFYRKTAILVEETTTHRLHIGLLTLCLFLFGLLDPRFAVVADILVWLILLIGYGMDRKRRSEIWGPPFLDWTYATVLSILLYTPLWWWRRFSPGALGGPLAPFPLSGADFMELWSPSPFYVGMAGFALAMAAPRLARSYRDQARLWFIVAGLNLWLAIGPEFRIAGHYLWWVPALYRGAGKIGLLADIDPSFFAAAAQFAFAILASYGFAALLTRMPPTRVLWLRPVFTMLLVVLLVIDYLRVLPFLP